MARKPKSRYKAFSHRQPSQALLGAVGGRRLGMERLEDRQLMAANVTALLSGVNMPQGALVPTLYIEGTDSADTIVVRQTNNLLSIDGLPQVFPANGVSKIVISSLGGKDTITLLTENHVVPALNLFGRVAPLSERIPSEIYGGDENDTINGGPGVDVVYGGNGNDTVFGNDGDDWLLGETHTDFLFGGKGKDFLDGGWGTDDLSGGNDDDVLHGGRDTDTLKGEGGHDRLYGDHGNDHLFGGSGDDGLWGGDGVDGLTGNSGNDRFLALKDLNTWTGKVSRDTIIDQMPQDAVVYFENGSGGRETLDGETVDYGEESWDEDEIERVDKAFHHLVRRTASNVLLKEQHGGDLTFVRVGWISDESIGGWNDDWGRITLPDTAFASDAILLSTVFHEIGHNWDNEGSIWEAFKGLSGWIQPGWGQNLTGYVPSGDGQWWHRANATFARNYGKTNPMEDFATVFEAVMCDFAGVIDGVSVNSFSAKALLVNSMLDLL
jgi:hypothetical protein